MNEHQYYQHTALGISNVAKIDGHDQFFGPSLQKICSRVAR